MPQLKENLKQKIEEHRPRITKLLKEKGDVKVGEVTISQTIGGMRGVKSLITDISYLDPHEGIRFRGYTIPEVMERLPKAPGGNVPTVESFVYLLLTGDIPSASDIKDISEEFKARAKVPQYVFDVLRAMPRDTHPMTMFSAGILAMQRESIFAKEYTKISKNDYWKPTYEDILNLLAKLPEIAAYVYRMKYKGDTIIPPNYDLDFGANFAHMMGIPKPYDDVARMYFILHSDHESGNASAHTGHLVASTLSDIYYSMSGMLNALAGPLHGLANESCMRQIQDMMASVGYDAQGNPIVPSEQEMEKMVRDILSKGVIMGYGHAVLRKTDPRYTTQREYCLKHLPNDPIFKYVDLLYNIVPPILTELGKAKNPWPNVDAQSGVIQWYYDVKEYDYYTVLFGVGRALGVGANLIWDRGLGYPLERPKSLTTTMLEEIAGLR